eukprot:6670047-Pyramimonas_sp.AAC.1
MQLYHIEEGVANEEGVVALEQREACGAAYGAGACGAAPLAGHHPEGGGFALRHGGQRRHHPHVVPGAPPAL